ncbi:glucose 1-dehydrogenase [Nocardioides cavernae]|uniref:Glucose 1-dehydrogenase n=1 Tax=Nocardioides cavernae TaxID=1921566 RepID=A0ABR8N804_9ACTN|nr:glucose 1-dehydrogenase [Nocardioides cavernae]
MHDLFSVDGRVAVVTGASSGIGARYAAVLADAGARVVVAARRQDRLESLAVELSQRGGDVIAMPCDVSEPQEVERLLSDVVKHHGRIDVMINNAGVAPPDEGDLETVAGFQDVVAVNLIGVYAGARAAAVQMLKQGRGAIINMSSISGLVAGEGIDTPSYIATKGAVVSLTRELAVRWAPDGVRVNAIAPGWIRTEMNAWYLDTDDGRSWVEARTPMGRAGSVSELDGAMLFLASDASSYVTGHTLVVDGGWVAR